jgi:hypothetical protein
MNEQAEREAFEAYFQPRIKDEDIWNNGGLRDIAWASWKARAAIQAIAPVPAVPERSLALNAALEYVGRHTPHLVYSEIAAALAAPQPAQQVAHKPLFTELIAKHPGLRDELLQQVEKPTIPAPPECKTEAERTAYAFGWFKALEAERNRPATQQEPAQDEPFAWATFDGEGGYDLRLYENNESYRDDYIKRNGPQFTSWVMALFTHPQASKPMTEQQAHQLCFELGFTQNRVMALIRGVERHHGIKE